MPLFITFEGLDGSGKSTQMGRARRWLEERGEPVTVSYEPGGTALGEALRGLFLARGGPAMDGVIEALLVFAARRQHLLDVIDPALAEGRHVLCDRFTDSTFAYQGGGRGVAPEVIEQLDRAATGGRRPDATLLLDLPAEEAQRRSGKGRSSGSDRLDDESLVFYERVRRSYLELAEEEPERIHVIDSAGELEATAAAVERQLERILGGSR